jgi:hypothetical protein
MLAKIVWHRTGDEIPFVPCHPELLEYYLERLNNDGRNKFSILNDLFPRKQVLHLRQSLESCSTLADRIPFEITEWNGDLLDQNYLNKLHREWVTTGQKHPKIILLLRKLGKQKQFRDINLLLHDIEQKCKVEFANYLSDPWQIDNPFGSQILDFDVSNIVMGFDNLGRSCWDKFLHHDDNVSDTDTNDQNMLTGRIMIALNRPLSNNPPSEYSAWCQKHSLPVIGARLNLGNVVNLTERLCSLRYILMNNTNESSDTFFFELCSK